MLGEDRALASLRDVLRLVPADEAEATVLIEDKALTRFANSAIHQNVAESNARLLVRAVVKGGVGTAITNRLDEDSLRRVAGQAAALARLQPPDPGWPGLPGAQPRQEGPSYVEATAATSAADRARAVRIVVDAASRLRLSATGAFSTEVAELAIANTAGLEAYAPATLASLRTVVDANPPQGLGFLTGYADAISRDVTRIDAQAVAARAVSKCVLNRDPLPLPPGAYVTVLEEIAVADLLRFLAMLGLSAQAVQEGRSFAVGQMDRQVCSQNLTLWDDATDGRGLALPFDWEGVPAGRLALIENGVLRGLTYDTRSAAREDKRSTGHAASQFPDLSSQWPQATHLFIAPGDTARDELMAGVERGVLVTRFHYTHCPDPQRLLVTGTTRDGTFLIKDGRIAGALRNLRFTQGVLEAFSNIEAISSRPELHRDWWSSAAHHVPAMSLGRFQFTAGTRF